MAGPPEPRICTATGLPAQVCADAPDAIERRASRVMTAGRSMSALHGMRMMNQIPERCPPRHRYRPFAAFGISAPPAGRWQTKLHRFRARPEGVRRSYFAAPTQAFSDAIDRGRPLPFMDREFGAAAGPRQKPRWSVLGDPVPRSL